MILFRFFTAFGSIPSRISLRLVAFASISLGQSATAQSNSELRVSDIPQAVQNNPAWLAAKFRVNEARGRLLQAGRLSNPELEIEALHGTDFREGAFSIAFSQSFPLTARLDLEKAVTANEVAIAEAEVRDELRRLIFDAQTAATEYLATIQQIAVQERRKAVTDELITFISTAAAAGELPLLDEKQTRLEAARAQLEIRKLRAEATSHLGRLRPLLGLEPDSELRLVGELSTPEPSRSLVTADSASNRPDLAAAQLAQQGARKEIALEEARRKEDITVGVFVEAERVEDAPEGLANEAFSGFRISIPLPLWNKNAGAVLEKQAKEKRLQGEASALRNSIRNLTSATQKEVDNHRDLFNEISNVLLPLAERQVTDLETVYRSGQGDLQSVLRAREEYLELEATRLDALRDYHLARLKLSSIAPSSPISIAP